MLGVLDVLAGNPAAADGRIRESLAIHTRLGADRHRSACLLGLAGVAALEGSPEAAARLFGQADALRGDSALEAPERVVVERFQPELEAALGREGFARIRAEGARLGPDDEPWTGDGAARVAGLD